MVVGEANSEPGATARNGQVDKGTSVSDDVTTALESEWKVVAGRTFKKGSVTIANESPRMKATRENGSKAHSIV